MAKRNDLDQIEAANHARSVISKFFSQQTVVRMECHLVLVFVGFIGFGGDVCAHARNMCLCMASWKEE